jgi:serine/threonine protein kinase
MCGLEKLHSEKIVHLYIKPSNIFFSEEERIYKLGM